MADKHFSDPARHAVKNPLLSSAVTGVSIEDLTQHAVLLPVVRANVQDSESHTAETITNRPPNFRNAISKPIDDSVPSKPKMESNLRDAQPNNDLKKDQDDFDVNEYFARLQGMKYVSAPLNSNLDGDKLKSEAVLESESEDVDSNFSEINLRDDSQSTSDVPEDSGQSLTADLAQNFSQLPQVLPQVASAVFSSFSNILNRNILNSRVEENEALKPTDYGNHSYGPAASNMMGSGDFEPVSESYGSSGSVQVDPVPMLNAVDYSVPGANAALSVTQKLDAPRPPDTGVANNFRLTSRKKHYAQIPGLRSGEIVDTSQTYVPQIPQLAGMPPRPPSVPHTDPLIPMIPIESQSQRVLNQATCNLPSMVPNKPRQPSKPQAGHFMGTTESQSQSTFLNQNTFNLEPLAPGPTTTPLVPHSKSTMIPSESPPQRFILNQPSTLNQENYPIPNSSISHNVPFIPKELNAGSHIPSLPPQTASSKPTEYKSSVMVLEPPISMKELIQNPFDYVKSSEPSLSVLNTQVQVPFTVAEPTELNAVNNRKPSILPNNPPMFETPSSLHYFSEKPNAMTENVPFIISTENSNNLERTKIANANVSGNITMPPNSNTSSSFKTHVLFQNTEVMPSVNSTDLSNMISGFSEMDSSDSKCNQPTFFNPQSLTDKETDKRPKNVETPPAQSNIFRLQNKKRPQYYSGPIVDKSGLLLDNLIPEMVKRDTKPPSPFVPPSVMQEPAFITPENSIFKPEFPESNFSDSNASVFDLNAQHAQPDCLGLDSNLSQVQNIDQDSAGNQNIGSTDVFGSFKSKLSAIKLDRIQNAVTTFFDPSFYNKDKKDDDSKNVNFQNHNSSINNQSGISSFDNSNQNMFNTVPLETVSDSYQNVDHSNSQHLNNPTITTIPQNSISFFNPPTQQTAEIPFSNSSMQHLGNNFSNSLQSESFYNPLQYSHGQITHSEMQQTELSSDNAVPQQSVSFYNPVQYSNETNTTLNLSSGSQKILLDDNKAVTNKSNFVGQQFQISHDMKKSLDIQPNISDNLSSSGFYNPLNYTNTNSNVQTNHVEIQQPQLSDDKSDLQNVPFYNPVDYLHETQLRTDFISNSQPVLIGCNEEVARLSNFDVQQSNVSVDLQRKRSLDIQPQENDNSNFPGFYNPLNYRDTKTNEQYPDIQIKSSNAGQSDYSTNVLFYNPKEYSNATNTIATDKESVGIHNKHTDNLYPTEFYHPLNYSMTSTGVTNVDLDSNSGQTHFNITENISLFNPLDYSKIEPDEVKLIKSDTSNITDLSKDIPTYNPLNYIEQQTQEQSLEQPQQSDNSSISDFYNPLNYSDTKSDDQNQTEQSDFSTNVLFYNPMEYSDATNRKPDLSSNEKATKKESVEVYNKHTVNSYPTEFTNNSRQTHFNVIENISLFNPSDYSEIKQDGTKLDESDTSYNNNLSMDITTYNPLNYTEQQSRKEIDSCFETQLTEHVSPSGQSQSGIKTSVPPLVPSYNPSPYLQTAESQSIDVAMQSKQNSQSNIATNIPHKVPTSDPSQYSSREAVEGQANVALCDNRLHPIHNEESSLKKPLFDLQDSVLKNAETTENVTFYSPVECAQKTFIVDPTLKDKFDPHRSETDFTEEMTALDDNLNSTEAYQPSELNPGKILDLENPTANITLYNPLEHYRNSNAESSEILIHNSNVKHSYTSQNIDFVKSSIKSDITECKDEILSESTSEIKDKLRNISFYDPQTLCQNISDLLPGVDTENSFVTSESYISFNPENAIEQIENTKERKLDNPLSFFESNFTDSFNLKTQRSLNTDSGTEREEKALSSSAEVTNDSIDLVDRTPIDETIKITKTQNLHSNVPNSEGMYSSIINYSNLDLDVNRQEYPPVVPQEQFYVDFSTDSVETKTLESESTGIKYFVSDANKRPMDHETNITNEYKVESVERPLHLDLPTNASDEVKAGFHQAMSPEDIEELSTQLSLTNMKEDNLRDYDVPPTAPPAEEFDHLECELKNLNKSSTEVAKEDVEEISSTTDDYKLANVIELDSNTEKNIGDTEGVNPTTPISFASYFDTGNFAVENHFKNSPLKQESESFISESIPIVNNSITSSSAELNTVLQADPLQFFGSMPPTTIKTEHTENNWLSNYFGQTTNESVSLGVSLEKAEPSVSESTSVNTDLFFSPKPGSKFFPDPPKTQPLIQSSQPLIPENQDIASDFYLTQDHNYYTQETKASEALNNQALCHLTIDNKSLKEPASADHTYQFSVPQLASPYQNYLPNFSYDQDQSSMQNPTLSSSFDVLGQNQDYNSKPVDSLNDPKDQQKSSFFHLTEDHNYFVDPEITSNMSETHRVLKNHTSVVYQSKLSSIDNSFNPFAKSRTITITHKAI